MPESPRYAIYHLPEDPDLAAFGAAWLGWDARAARVPAPLEDMAMLWPGPDSPCSGARRYGLHATMKAPFRLAPGTDLAGLQAALADVSARRAPFDLPGPALARIGGFLALVPATASTALQDLAAGVVRDLDRFRAPLTPDDLQRRNPDRLSPRQRALLDAWGYPHVMEEFRFHITLTDNLGPDRADALAGLLEPRMTPLLRSPYRLSRLALLVEGPDGRFRLVSEHPLTASPAT